MKPLTFIILVNYNNHDDTLKCLNSIADAGHEKNVIVVDNNSTSHGVDAIKTQFPNTVLIKNHENMGFGRANNIGIEWVLKNTNCENVFILNNDTTINKATISTLEKVLACNENIAVTAPKIVMMDDPKVLWYGGGEIDWKKCSARIPGYHGPANNALACTTRFVSFASGCAMLVKSKVLKELGGFDQRFFMYVEDLELCIRIQKKGFQILYTPDAIVFHKGQGSQRSDGAMFYPIDHPKNPNLDFYIYHLTKDRILTVRQHGTGINLLKFCFCFPIFMLAKAIQYLIHDRFETINAIRKGVLDSFENEK